MENREKQPNNVRNTKKMKRGYKNDCKNGKQVKVEPRDADDTDIFGRSQSAVRDAYLALEREAATVGLKINEQKKNMIAARNVSDVENVFQGG
jgi:hypothetical protein